MTTWISPAFSATISSIQNNRVILNLDEEDWTTGDRLIARDSDGKAKAILQVTQIQGKQASVTIVKGKLEKNHVIAKWVSVKKSTGKSGTTTSGKANSSWGFALGTTSNSMTVKPSATTSSSLSGTSFHASAFYQRKIDGALSTRLFAGYHSLQATGASSNLSTCALEDCKVDISYLGLEGVIRYSFWQNQTWDIWAGAGLGFLFALSKESNVLDTNKITANQTILFSLGTDWILNKNSFIPIQFDYAQHPDNSTSSTSQTYIRLGYGRRF